MTEDVPEKRKSRALVPTKWAPTTGYVERSSSLAKLETVAAYV